MQLPPNLVVVDLETTGNDPSLHDPISIAFAPFNRRHPDFQVSIKYTRSKWTDYARGAILPKMLDWPESALEPDLAYDKVSAYLRSVAPNQSITLVGHNIAFDIAFLRRLAQRCRRPFFSQISHRLVDTHSLLYVLHLLGRIPASALASDGAFQWAGLRLESKRRHTAVGDADATRTLFERLVREFEGQGSVSSSS